MRRMRKYKDKDNNPALRSSGTVPIVQDTQSTAQEDIIHLEEDIEENIENESIQEEFIPRRNPKRVATRNVNYTPKNYALVGLSSEDSTRLLTVDDLFLSTVGAIGDNFKMSRAVRTLD